jgi:DNA-binding transcriptional ArsR family regulator
MFEYRSKITQKDLGYYFLNPERTHYINELADLLGVDPGNLFRKLKELEQEGILVSEMRGNQKYFSLNKKYPLLHELKKIYNAKYGVTNLLKEKIEKLKGLQSAWIFGSYAKDSFQQESDIDLLFIGNHSSLEAKRLILPLEKTWAER